MLPIASLTIAVSLSMDSFAAALGRGACRCERGLIEAIRVGVVFALCQITMPLLGWLVGRSFLDLVSSVDHWIAFVLLLLVGGSMLWSALFATDEPCERGCGDWLALVATGVATSIDAAAVGIGLALADFDISTTLLAIGTVTFLASFGGVLVGRVAGPYLGRRAEILGGIGLIGIGTKILLDHTVG